MSKTLDIKKLENYPYTDGGKLEIVGLPEKEEFDITGNISEEVTSLSEISAYVEVVKVPSTVTSFETGAFTGCTGLTDIYYDGTEEEWEAITGLSDAGIVETATIHFKEAEETEENSGEE